MTSFNTIKVVRFGHVDPAGIAYFPRIFDFVHEVFEELWETHVGQRYDKLILGRRLGFPLVHSHVDFVSPLHFGDRLQVRVVCAKLGHSSLALRYRFYRDDTLCVDALMTTVCVNMDGLKPVPIPDEFRHAFEEILEAAK